MKMFKSINKYIQVKNEIHLKHMQLNSVQIMIPINLLCPDRSFLRSNCMCLILLLLLMPTLVCSAVKEPAKNIYIVNSYNYTAENTGPMISEQLALLQDNYPLAEYFIYDIDNDRFNDALYDLVSSEISIAVATYPADIVIANGYDSYFFVMNMRDLMFPDVPIVFSGITDIKGRIPVIPAGVTGIPDIMDIESIIETALHLHPKTENLLIILDRKISGRKALPSYLEKAINSFQDRLNIQVLKNKTINEVSKTLKEADDHTIALMYPLIFNSDFDRRTDINPYHEITDQNKVPIYTFYDFFMNIGVMGGYISSTVSYGRMSANFALRILAGEDVSNIPVPESGFQDLILDYQVLQKFSVPVSRLPSNAIIVNKPSSFYEENKLLVWFVSFAFLVLVLTILSLSLILLWRHRMQKKLDSLKRYLLDIIDSMPSSIISVDSTGRIHLWNQAATSRTGISATEAVGRLFLDVLPDYRVEMVQINKSIEKGTRFSTTHEHTSPKEQIRYENITVFPLTTNDIDGAVFRIDDVTQEKQIQQKLNQAQKMESIGTLAGGIAHDFNNILASVLGFTELALDGVDEGTPLKDDLEEIYASGLRAKDLVKQILTFARQSKEEVQPIQVSCIVKEVLKFLRSSIPASVDIKQHIHSESFIMGNATQLHQILMNLCTNSAQAMEENGVF